jgi:hypothetical protein
MKINESHILERKSVRKRNYVIKHIAEYIYKMT